MAKYLVDYCLSLYHSEEIEAEGPEEARSIAELRLLSDEFWAYLLDCYDDPQKTDWLPENVEVSCYGKVGEESEGYRAI